MAGYPGLAFFDTTVSADALVESLEHAGLTGEVLLVPADTKLEGAMSVARAHWRNRALTWHAHGLNQLLYELAEPDVLARGIGELIQMDDPPGEPVFIHKGEAASWFSYEKKKPKRKYQHGMQTSRSRKLSRS